MSEVEAALFGALIGAIVGGFVTFLGTLYASRHELRRDARSRMHELLPDLARKINALAQAPSYAHDIDTEVESFSRISVLAGRKPYKDAQRIVVALNEWKTVPAPRGHLDSDTGDHHFGLLDDHLRLLEEMRAALEELDRFLVRKLRRWI